MNDKLYAEWEAYSHRAWKSGQTILDYDDWIDARIAALEAALTPFAAYGRLKLRYAPEAVFTIAYDREGHEVILHFENFTRAAELLPNATGRTSATKAQGGAGGIAEIMIGATQDREYRVRYVTADGETCYARVLTASAEKAAALVRDAVRTATEIEVLTPDEVTP